MRNLLFTLRFVGTRYCGFQVQKNALSVAEVFQDAAEAVFKSRPDIKGCSRTDAGVHALAFGLSLKTDSRIPADKLPLALNARLPADAAVIGCREVPPDFHARYSATAKRYVYKILNSSCRDPFMEGLALRYPVALDAEFLNREAGGFLGVHDFSAFCNAGSSVADKVRRIDACSVVKEGDLVYITVEGNGFLYNMVRIMAGTLLDIAGGKIPPGSIADIIASRDRSRAGITAPAHGLYLSRVYYPSFEEDDAKPIVLL